MKDEEIIEELRIMADTDKQILSPLAVLVCIIIFLEYSFTKESLRKLILPKCDTNPSLRIFTEGPTLKKVLDTMVDQKYIFKIEETGTYYREQSDWPSKCNWIEAHHRAKVESLAKEIEEEQRKMAPPTSVEEVDEIIELLKKM